jgi:hypothetical protein
MCRKGAIIALLIVFKCEVISLDDLAAISFHTLENISAIFTRGDAQA